MSCLLIVFFFCDTSYIFKTSFIHFVSWEEDLPWQPQL